VIQILRTVNYSANLDRIEAYWDDCQFPAGNHKLLAELEDTVVGNLLNHPRIGRKFLRRFTSRKPAADLHKLEGLLTTLGTSSQAAEVREYVLTDYLLLYALVGEVIYLLAIKHQKQLAFRLDDLDAFRQSPD
jgi:hypothetical protein